MLKFLYSLFHRDIYIYVWGGGEGRDEIFRFYYFKTNANCQLLNRQIDHHIIC